MRRQLRRKPRESRDELTSTRDANHMLIRLLALDRALVALSMGIYSIPRRQRFMMREQNRRLHHAIREHLPRFVELAQGRFQALDGVCSNGSLVYRAFSISITSATLPSGLRNGNGLPVYFREM